MFYVVTARDIGRVKIGFSEKPAHRFVKIHTDSPVALALERVCEGSVDDERALHIRFAEYRDRGEWFRLTDEIEQYMAGLNPPATAARRESINKIIIAATGCSKAYASQMVSSNNGQRMPIPVAVAVFRHSGHRVGPLAMATDSEIDTLEKFCGRYGQSQSAAA